MGYLHTGVIPFLDNSPAPAPFDAEEQALANALFPKLDFRAQAKIRNMLTIPWNEQTQKLPGSERVKFVVTSEWFDGWVVQKDVRVLNWLLATRPWWNDHAAKLLIAMFCPNSKSCDGGIRTINENLKRLSRKVKNGDKHWRVRLEDLATCQVWEWRYGKKFQPIELK